MQLEEKEYIQALIQYLVVASKDNLAYGAKKVFQSLENECDSYK